MAAALVPALAGCFHHEAKFPVFHGPPVERPNYQVGDLFLYLTRTKDLTGAHPDRAEYSAEILDGFEDLNGTQVERWITYSEEWGIMNNGTVRVRGDTTLEWRRSTDGAVLSTYASSTWHDNPGQTNQKVIQRWTVNEYFDAPCLRLQDLVPHAIGETFTVSCDSTIQRTQTTPGEGPPSGSEQSHVEKQIDVRFMDIIDGDLGVVEAFRLADDKDPDYAPVYRWYAPARCAAVAGQVLTGTKELKRTLLFVSRCDMGDQHYASSELPPNFPFNPYRLELRDDQRR